MTAMLRRSVPVCAAVLLAVVAFAFRLATTSFTNDDYLHLALAQQVSLGELPIRDFVDVGEFLFVYISAFSQQVFGRNLLTEVALDLTFIAVGHAICLYLVYTITRSIICSLLAGSFAVIMIPRLYAYPKVFLYALAVWVIWRYIDVRSCSRLLALAFVTATAFLFRHDHGFSIGLTCGVLLLLVHRHDGPRIMTRQVLGFAAAAIVLLMPYATFVHLNGGIPREVRTILGAGRAEYERTVGTLPSFHFRLASPRINVRWNAGAPDDERVRLEHALSLSNPTRRDRWEWQYDLRDTSTNNVRAIVHEPTIADTSGIDRDAYRVTAQTIEPNVHVWFYWLTMALPIVALASLWRSRGELETRDERLKIAAVAALATIGAPFLLRSASESAVSDVSSTTAVLGGIMLARVLASRWEGRMWDVARVSLAGVVIVGTMAAASRSGGIYLLEQLVHALGSDGLGTISSRADDFRQSAPPMTEGGRYLHRCTRESDRLLVAGYAPDVYYKAGRGFAAGIPYFFPGYWTEYGDAAMAQLERQRVPIVLSDGDNLEAMASLPGIRQYVVDHYRQADDVLFGDQRFTVLADSRLPASVDRESGLPCFAP